MRSWWIVCFLSWYAVAVQNVQGSECVLATPVINFSPLQNTVQLETELLEDGQEAWIGYAMEYVEFQYIGCVSLAALQDVNITEREIRTSPNPGQCYFACKQYPIFGLSAVTTEESSCRCLPGNLRQTDMHLKETTCVTLCKDGEFLCGSIASMSLYKRVTVTITTLDNNDNCLSYSRVWFVKRYYWRSCHSERKAMCISDTNSFTKGNTNAAWSKSIRACFDINSYPAPYQTNRSTSNTGWSGVIRTMAITNYSDYSTRYSLYGYVKKVNDHHVLGFKAYTSSITSEICELESGRTSISTAKTTTTESVTIKSSVTTEYTQVSTQSSTQSPLRPHDTTMLKLTTTSPYINNALEATATFDTTKITTSTATDSMNHSISESLQSTQDSQQSNVGVFVGVPVAILVLFGILCAVIFLWRRRKQLKDATASSNTQHNGAYMCDYSGTVLGNKVSDGREVDPQTTHLQPNVYDSVSDIRADDYHQNANINTYANIENVMHDNQTPGVTEKAKTSEDHGDHTYVVLEKTEKQPHQTNNTSRYTTPEGATNNSANHVNNIAGYSTLNVDKGVYDHIGGNQGRPRDDTSHYDTTSFTKQTDGLYDTTSSSKQTDGMYDTTSSAKQPDGTYDTTSPTKQADGTYDKTSNTKYTDGMYDITAYTK